MIGWINKWYRKRVAPRTVEKLLGELGSNSREVANVLRHMGIRGERNGNREGCPIAIYMKQQGYPISVGTLYSYLIEGDGDNINWRFAKMPEACADFVRDFDAGAYPDLVK